MTDITNERRPVSKWRPGQSGNPAGRPKGVRNKITMMKEVLEGELRAQVGPQMAAVLAKAISMALDGNEQMIKLLVDKTVPTTKSREDEPSQKEKVIIQIGRLPDRVPDGTVINGETHNDG